MILMNENDVMQKRKAGAQYQKEQDSKWIDWQYGHKTNFEPALNAIQKNLIFED